MNLRIIDFKQTEYRNIWEEQKKLFNMMVDSKKSCRPIDEEYLLIGEHPPVYTLGFHGNANNLLADENRLRELGAECIRIERGGDITYHGPGQMIVYPIIDLEYHSLGIKGYMNLLEDCVIELLREYGIKGEKIDDAIGIWIGKGAPDERKICAMGVKCTRFVTMHGLALNVTTDLNAFSLINPCGFIDKGVTSIEKETGVIPSMEDVKQKFIMIFRKLIGFPLPHTPFQGMS